METATRNGQHPPVATPCLPATPQPVLERPHPSLLAAPHYDLRVRTGSDYQGMFHRLTADIAARGVQVPIIAYRESPRLRVIDGETRRQAALLAGVDSVPVLVYAEKPDDKAILLGQLLANSMRLDMTPLEYAATYQQLMKANGWSQAELAKNVHASPAQVAKVLAISTKLCDQAQALVASGDLSPRAAYALTRLPDHQQQAELARKAVDLPMAVESVEEAVNKLLGGKKAKAKPLKLRLDGVQMVASNATLENLQAFGERLVAAVKRLVKDGDAIEYLPSRLKAP